MENKTNKSLGQHWLYDDHALERMVIGADVRAGDTVLEIGPGLGTLTDKLLETGAQVHCVEFDDSLIPALRKKFKSHSNFTVEHADILKFDFSKLPHGYHVAANIPYYLTSNLLRLMCESPVHFSRAALLMQKEVAQRVCARPGTMSILSVSVQFYCEVALDEIVPATLFTPPPKVDSQILKLQYRTIPLFENVDSNKFFRIVKAGFSERRKMLRSSLSGGLGISKTEAEKLLASAGIEPTLRAQALRLEDWYRLYKILA